MVKKSRRQREGTERVYPYSNVVDQDIPGQNTDSVETSVACDEYSTTMFQPEASNKSPGVLRLSLQKKTSQYKSSKLEGGSEDLDPGRSSLAMHAVANGERMEAFKNGEHETANGSKSLPGPSGAVGKRAAHDRPCPKSKKSRDDANGSEARELPEQTAGVAETTGEVPETTEAVVEAADEKEDADDSGVAQEEEEGEHHVNGVTDECNVGDSSAELSVNGNAGSEAGNEESEVENAGSELGNEGSELGNAGSDVGNAGSEHGNDGSEAGNAGSDIGNEGSDIGNDGSDIGNEGSEIGNEGSDLGNEGSEAGHEGSEHGIEGIVTEPEDHADHESCIMSDPDVTISFVEGEEEEEEESDADRSEDPPLIEFPEDSPGKTPRSLQDPSDPEDSPGKIPLSTQDPSHPEDSDMDIAYESDSDSPNTTMERGYKVLHRLLNPTTTQPAQQREKDFSFGRSLRSLSGRQSVKPRGGDEEAEAPAPSESFFNFGLGKRKSEGGERQPEAKRPKPDEGVDSLGFFARLTSPVVERLRAIRVGSPFRPREVTGHEEMAVALLPVAQPRSERCVLM